MTMERATCQHYAEFPAWLDINEMLVGRYGFAIKICAPARPFARGSWFVLRPACKHISGPFGTRQKALQCLDEPNYPNEKQWGNIAAIEWLRTQKAGLK